MKRSMKLDSHPIPIYCSEHNGFHWEPCDLMKKKPMIKIKLKKVMVGVD